MWIQAKSSHGTRNANVNYPTLIILVDTDALKQTHTKGVAQSDETHVQFEANT